MAYLEWQDKLDTGIDVIDRQHKRIVEYINQLYDVTQSHNKDLKVIKTTIIELIDYTLSHFEFEEALIEEANFIGCVEHEKKHKLFSKKIFEYQERLVLGEDVSEPLLVLLHDWLFGHILHEDKLYVTTVKKFFMK